MASQEAIAQSLAQDRPTIGSAVKSFVSLFAARNLTREDCTSEDALQQARCLLKAINNYTFPLKRETTDEYNVVAQVWNGLIASQQKPSRFLGRMALVHAWQNGLPEEIEHPSEEESLFCDEFGSLLLKYNPSPTEESDACLLWDDDKGEAELARRRQRRTERAQQQQVSSAPTIEELSEEDQEENKTTE
jgi:hypothetical protein